MQPKACESCYPRDALERTFQSNYVGKMLLIVLINKSIRSIIIDMIIGIIDINYRYD